ncbi:MAG: nucleotidyl transferase AbiEii/AbiGii toxin family protein [Candidatus Margulisiibacteriota bacterium]
MIESFYEAEFKALNKHKIRYLIIGGVAVNLYGLHRLTRDLDLMIDLSKEHFEQFIEVMRKLGYKSKVPKTKWAKCSAVAFHNLKEEDKRIDVFLHNPIDFNEAYKKRKLFKCKGFSISCVSIDDLITMKDKADRIRDWIDVGSLKRIMEIKHNEIKR